MKAEIIVSIMVVVVTVHCRDPVSEFSQGITVKNCGRATAKHKVIGGTHAAPGRYPWMVSLHKINGTGFKHLCGAAVLNENWVITAAHCVKESNKPSKYKILVGLHKQSRQDASTVQKYKVSKIVQHEGFFGSFENDIALLRTARPIDIAGSEGFVNGICLPKTKEEPTGCVKVIGWGFEQESGEMSDTLKQVSIPIVPRNRCQKAYSQSPNAVSENMICAGKKNKDSCQMDSGGPLFKTDRNDVSTLIGIVSFGEGCGSGDYPGVYTRISPYLDWIQRVVKK